MPLFKGIKQLLIIVFILAIGVLSSAGILVFLTGIFFFIIGCAAVTLAVDPKEEE